MQKYPLDSNYLKILSWITRYTRTEISLILDSLLIP